MQKIFGIIGWIGTVLVFGAVAVRMFYPEWNQYATYAAWAGLVAVLVYMAGQWRDVAQFYEGARRQVRHHVDRQHRRVPRHSRRVNYLGTRQSKRWDLTANQVYSLSDQTIKILKDLKEPVKVTVFERNDRQDVHKDRLQEFEYQTSKLTTEYVDPDREPTRATSAKIDSLPTILFEYKGRTERVTSSNEQDLTNALIKVVTGKTRKVYFTQGHGEKDTASSDRTGFSTVIESMKQDNFVVEPLVLVQQKAVPDDATIVVIAGPTTDFFPPEMDALNSYAAKGGKVMVLLDPLMKGPAQPLLTQFLADWGIRAGTDVVLDARRHGPDARDRRIGAGGGAVPSPPDHRRLPGDHCLSDGPDDGADRRRIQRAHGAAAGEYQRAKLVGSRRRLALIRQGASGIQCRQGRQAGADHAGRRGLRAGDGYPAAAVREWHAGRPRSERKP
jgi:hypothetical protein